MMPSPEQIAAMQRQLAIDAEKMGMTVPQFIGELAAIRWPPVDPS
jgi:translocation protein SEC62